jgi:hypothetical protein
MPLRYSRSEKTKNLLLFHSLIRTFVAKSNELNMKNVSKLLCFILFAMLSLCSLSVEAKPKQTKLYVFGVSMNLTDSVTYITEVQLIDPAFVETKTGFMYDRSIYSQQLQLWVEYNKNQPASTCTIFFSEKKSKIDKKYAKVRNRYLKDQGTILRSLSVEDFQFIPQEWSEHETL